MKKYTFTILKYLFSIILCLLAFSVNKSFPKLIFCLLELLFIFLFSDFLKRFKYIGTIFNYIALFIYNAEMLFAYMGGSFITLVMLENTDSIRDLGGKVIRYSIGVILTLIFTFLPHKKIISKFKYISLLCIPIAIAEIVTIIVASNPLFPTMAVVDIYFQYQNQLKMEKMIAEKAAEVANKALIVSESQNIEQLNNDNQSLDDNEEMTKNCIEANSDEAVAALAQAKPLYDLSYLKYEEGAAAVTEALEHPTNKNGNNIILIITEGLSQNVIDDSRNIMPNVSYYQNHSMNFKNYFNHTFATYRGIIGQLYSGHQMDNYDTNSLPSIMDVLEENNYHTVFINTEPENNEFSSYLNNLGFDEVLEFSIDQGNIAGALLDKNAYKRLFETASRLSTHDEPYFLVIYTFGTHASMNSPDEKYGDGSNPLLNRFYNNDYQFGKFMESFTHTNMPEDTMVIYTADHSTFGDEDFFGTFTKYNRKCNDCDSIPFFIYFSGWNQTYDAAGRNSLDIAPTLLDLLGLEAPKSFLGASLFEPKMSGMSLDTYFWDSAYICYTGDSIPRIIYDESQDLLIERISEYFAIK